MGEFLDLQLLISDYYESLRFEMDIYADEELRKACENDTLNQPIKLKRIPVSNSGNDDTNKENNQKSTEYELYGLEILNDPYKEQQCAEISSSSHVESVKFSENVTLFEYFTEIRIDAINELKRVEKKTLEHYNKSFISTCGFSSNVEMMANEATVELLRSQIFANGFCFLINFNELDKLSRTPIFKLCTIVTNFYLNQNHIRYLK